MTMRRRALRCKTGFSLVEVALALGVAAFCLIPLIGLLPVGISSNRASTEQTAATSVAANVIADLRAAPPPSFSAFSTSATPSVSPQFAVPLPLPGATSNVATIFVRADGTEAIAPGADPKSMINTNASPAQNPRYRVTMTLIPPATGGRSATAVRVLVTWPATSDPTAANAPSNFSGAFESVVALDRN